MSIALVTSPVGGLSSARGVAVTSELEDLFRDITS